MQLQPAHPTIRQPWLRVLLFMLALIGVNVLAGAGFEALVKKGLLKNVSEVNITIIALIIFAATTVGVVIVFRKFIDRKYISGLGFTFKEYKADAAAGFLLGVALLCIGALVLYINNNLEWTDITFDALDFVTAIILLLLIAVSEEMAFRGYVLNNLLESMNKWVALGTSAVLFALMHSLNPGINFLSVVNLLLGGLLLGINFIYTRNLWFAVLLHFSWNFFQGPVLGFPVSGLELRSVLYAEHAGNPLLTGNEFGFEGSVICSVVLIVALLILYAVYEKQFAQSTAPA